MGAVEATALGTATGVAAGAVEGTALSTATGVVALGIVTMGAKLGAVVAALLGADKGDDVGYMDGDMKAVDVHLKALFMPR